MTIKSWVFVLFLSLCLAWAIAASQAGGDIVHLGLRFTIYILAGALAIIIATRLLGWWQVRRAKAPARPKAAIKPDPVHEDDAALAVLIRDANSALAKSSNYRGPNSKSPLSGLPFYLLIGPSGAGKTTTLLNSGTEPHLLAGDCAAPNPGATRLGNIWLAKNSIFFEVSGRIFADDLGRWKAFLSILHGNRSIPLWRRLWREPSDGVNLRGVIAFCEVKELTGAAGDPRRLEQQCREWQERLIAVGETFGADYPVYQVITKCDAVPFFSDFFSRLPEVETNQVLGCTLPFRQREAAQTNEGFAAAEAKRLAGAFRPLYHTLAQRRVDQLVHEPNPAKKPGIYEFPREFKRLRAPLVQFLTDAFRPNPLRPGAVLRGFYLTAIQEQEIAAAKSIPGDGEWTDGSVSLESTRLFRGDATQIFNPGDPDRGGPRSRKGFRSRWLFVGDLLQQVILADRPFLPLRSLPNRGLERYRRVALVFACASCILLCCAFVTSWASNRALLNDVAGAALKSDIRKHDSLPTLADLQALDELRNQVVRLQTGESLRYRWGLYTGNAEEDDAAKAYFARFQRLLLADLNEAILTNLRSVSSAPGPDDPDEPAFDFLKTHLMISSGSCKPDAALASRTLKKALALLAPNASLEWLGMASRQIDFYAAALVRGNPCHLPEDTAVRDHARQYLQGIKSTDRIYQAIIADAEKSVTKPKQLVDLAPNYQQVLTGNGALSPAFTQAGWQFVQDASKKAGPIGGLGDVCVTGTSLVSDLKAGPTGQSIQQRYIRDYIDHWQQFLAGFSVTPYRGLEDAAHKVGILADHRSPLLAVLALTADQTNFTLPAAKGIIPNAEKKFNDFVNGEKGIQQVAGAEPHRLNVLDIAAAFQPVQYVVPPPSDRWITDKNGAYINSLNEFQAALQALARATSDSADPQNAQAAADKALQSVQQLQQGFNAEGVGNVDREVTRLLREPITRALPLPGPPSPDKKITAELQKFCQAARPVLAKYPFSSSRPEGQPNSEATLKEVQDLFAPEDGAVWKFQKAALAELTVLDGGFWKANPSAQKIKPSTELLAFLNRAEQIRRALFSGGNNPHFTFTLRPRLASNSIQLIQLTIDGKSHDFTATQTLQAAFSWPPATAADATAQGRSGTVGATSGFSAHSGLWAVFRFFADAEPRDLGSHAIEWKETKGRTGLPQPLDPPVQLEFAGASAGDPDIFNPEFFKGFSCPAKATQ